MYIVVAQSAQGGLGWVRCLLKAGTCNLRILVTCKLVISITDVHWRRIFGMMMMMMMMMMMVVVVVVVVVVVS